MLVIDEPTEMEHLSIQMSLALKPDAELPRQPPSLVILKRGEPDVKAGVEKPVDMLKVRRK